MTDRGETDGGGGGVGGGDNIRNKSETSSLILQTLDNEGRQGPLPIPASIDATHMNRIIRPSH